MLTEPTPMGSAKEVLSKAEVNENPVIKTPEHTHEEFRLSVLATSHCWKTAKESKSRLALQTREARLREGQNF